MSGFDRHFAHLRNIEALALVKRIEVNGDAHTITVELKDFPPFTLNLDEPEERGVSNVYYVQVLLLQAMNLMPADCKQSDAITDILIPE